MKSQSQNELVMTLKELLIIQKELTRTIQENMELKNIVSRYKKELQNLIEYIEQHPQSSGTNTPSGQEEKRKHGTF